MEEIIKLIKFNTNKINENCYKIETNVNFKDFSLSLFLKKDGENYLISDNQSILKFMNDVYILKSQDVKKCINSILNLYNATLKKGEIFKKIEDIKNINQEIMNFIMMAGQLAFMFVFFEE